MTAFPLLPIKTVIAITSLSRATIYRRINDSTFPRQVDLGGRRIAFRRDEIDQWIANPSKFRTKGER